MPSAFYGADTARSCCAVAGGPAGGGRFAVATHLLRSANAVHVVDFDGGAAAGLVSKHATPHECWALAAAPAQPDGGGLLVAAVTSDAGVAAAGVWAAEGKDAPLAQRAALGGGGAPPRQALWCGEASDRVAVVEEDCLRIWDLQGAGAAREAAKAAGAGAADTPCAAGCVDPRNASRVVTASGTTVNVWDVRDLAGGPAVTVGRAALMPVRDVDVNPVRDHVLLTAGDDCKLRFWDVRQPDAPLLELAGHSHWVWQAKFNPTHDQLVLSGSSDSLVALWTAPSAAGGQVQASAASAPKSPGGTPAPADRQAAVIDEHEDSVYGVAWSLSDPFVFCSLSYDGRLLVNAVPSEVKYEVLL